MGSSSRRAFGTKSASSKARTPSAEEIRSAVEYLDRKAASAKPGKDAAETTALQSKARREAWEDLTWALLNTKEFLFNH